MTDVRFCVGFSKACKQAREGGGLPGYEGEDSRGRCLRPWFPPDIVRLIDALVRRLEHEGVLVRMNRGVLGRTLCEAAAAGGLRDVRFLLARGADVKAETTYVNMGGVKRQRTALWWAADAGHLAVSVLLLDAGAGKLDLALYRASYNVHTPIVALLLDRGADIHFRNGDVLVSAACGGHLAIATLLLDRGADIHVRDDRPLVTAAQCGRLEMVQFLLDRGADLHTMQGRTLRVAVRHGQLEIVRLLLDRGADIHAADEAALFLARLNRHAAVEALLLERGALEPEEEED